MAEWNFKSLFNPEDIEALKAALPELRASGEKIPPAAAAELAPASENLPALRPDTTPQVASSEPPVQEAQVRDVQEIGDSKLPVPADMEATGGGGGSKPPDEPQFPLSEEPAPEEESPRSNKKIGKALKTAGVIGAGIGAVDLMGGGGSQPPAQTTAASKALNPDSDEEENSDDRATTGQHMQDVADKFKGNQDTEAKDKSANSGPQSLQDYAKNPAVLKMFDIQGTSPGTAQSLADAQAERNDAVSTNQIARGAARIAGAIGHSNNINDDLFTSNIAEANERLKQYQQKVENEKYDPNSAMSQAFKAYMKNLGYDIKGDFTAAAGEKIVPTAYQQFNQDQERQFLGAQGAANRASKEKELELTRENQKEMLREKLLEDQHKYQYLRGAKADEQKDKLTDKYRNEATNGANKDIYQNYQKIKNAQDVIAKAAQNPNAYTDFSAIMTGLGALQNNKQALRQTSLKLGLDAAGTEDKIKNWWDSAARGQKLQPDQYQQMQAALQIAGDSSKSEYVGATKKLYNRAKSAGLPLEEIFDDPSMYSNHPAQGANNIAKNVIKKGYNPTTDQTQLIYSDGSKEIVPGRQ